MSDTLETKQRPKPDDLTAFIAEFVAERKPTIATRVAANGSNDVYTRQLAQLNALEEQSTEIQHAFEAAVDGLVGKDKRVVAEAVASAVEHTGYSVDEVDHELSLLQRQYQSPSALNVTPERKSIETRGLVHRMTDSNATHLDDRTIDQYVFLRNTREKLAAHSMNVIRAVFSDKKDRGRDMDLHRTLVQARRELVSDLSQKPEEYQRARVSLHDFEKDILAATQKITGIKPSALPDR